MAGDHPIIDEAFFRKYASGNANKTYKKWRGWYDRWRVPRADDAQYFMVLELCSRKSSTTITHFMKGEFHRISRETYNLLRRIAKGYGREPKEWIAHATRTKHRHAALITQMVVPSRNYHFEILHGLARFATEQAVSLSIHNVANEPLTSVVDRVCGAMNPDVLVFLRLTPRPEDLTVLRDHGIPAVLIHADRYDYPDPVLANLVPDHRCVAEHLHQWLDERPTNSALRRSEVVLVTMPAEKLVDPEDRSRFAQCARGSASIRNERRTTISHALARLRPQVMEVKDYSFRRAIDVYQAHPHARLYVCLSDDIAIALKLALIAAGQPWEHRIVGFDGSAAACEERIPSFDQQLGKVAEEAMRIVCEYLDAPEDSVTPTFSERRIPVQLTK